MPSAQGEAGPVAALLTWLDPADADAGFGPLLASWALSGAYQSAGLVPPTGAPLSVSLLGEAPVAGSFAGAATELGQVRDTLERGAPTATWQLPNSAGRLYTLLGAAGREPGLLWVERAGAVYGEAERQALGVAARLIARHPAFLSWSGVALDPARLATRLQDASVIAGRVAHDFDNILTGIVGFSDLARPLLAAGSPAEKFVGEIAKVGARGIALTKQLHQLSRSGSQKPAPGSVSAVVAREVGRFPNAAFDLDLADYLPTVAMDAGPLGVVLGHLIANAVEASPPGGVVSIRAELVELADAEARSYLGSAAGGRHVAVAVRDSGPGFKPGTEHRVLAEPFLTTKVNQHRGLGLPVCYRTLSAHRGGLRLEAHPGGGICARAVVPLSAARPAVVQPIHGSFAPPTALGSAPALVTPPLLK